MTIAPFDTATVERGPMLRDIARARSAVVIRGANSHGTAPRSCASGTESGRSRINRAGVTFYVHHLHDAPWRSSPPRPAVLQAIRERAPSGVCDTAYRAVLAALSLTDQDRDDSSHAASRTRTLKTASTDRFRSMDAHDWPCDRPRGRRRSCALGTPEWFGARRTAVRGELWGEPRGARPLSGRGRSNRRAEGPSARGRGRSAISICEQHEVGRSLGCERASCAGPRAIDPRQVGTRVDTTRDHRGRTEVHMSQRPYRAFLS